MNCQRAQDLIDGYVDGELDLVNAADIERHIADCTSCARASDARLALRAALGRADLYQRAPDGLVRSMRPRHHRHLPLWIGAIATALAAALALALIPGGLSWRSDRAVLDELTSAHVRSLLADHLTDVTSTDQHTVKPWFEGKLDFAPPVQDFSSGGFDLVGGRLDYIDGCTAAALVYRRHKHLVNVFVWPQPGADLGQRAASQRGFNVVRWRRAGLAYRAVSDLNPTELSELARLIAGGP